MNEIPARLDPNNVTIYVRANSTSQRIAASSDTPVVQVMSQSDWNELDPSSPAYVKNKPQIEGVTLQGNKTYEQLNLERVTNSEIENMFG